MKKFAILSVLALGLGFTACDNYEEPNPAPQQNAQEPILSAEGVEVASGFAPDVAIDLGGYNEQGMQVPMAVVKADGGLASTYQFEFVLQLSKDASFANPVEVPTTLSNDTVFVSPDALDGAYVQAISKDPNAREVNVRYVLYAIANGSDGNTRYRVGGPDVYYASAPVLVKPFDPGYVIEEEYYLVGTGSNGTIAEALPFQHSSLSPYDDPKFTLILDVTADQAAAGYEWAIIPASTKQAGSFTQSFSTPDDQTLSAEGELEEYTGAPVYGVIEEPGRYKFDINMESKEYHYYLAFDNLYVIGGGNGWDFGVSHMLQTDNYINYWGYAVLDGEFKFTSAPDWGALGNFGAGDEPGTIINGSNNNNVLDGPRGLYFIKVDLAEMTYEVTLINTYGVIGDATPGSWGASTPLVQTSDYVFEGDITFGGGEWKFRANDDWAVNLGGEVANLIQDGANLASPGSGLKHLTLDLGTIPYRAIIQ